MKTENKTEKEKHTAGPWLVSKKGGLCLYIKDKNGSKSLKAGFRPSLLESKNNAQLIAAAPDLYDACVEARVVLGNHFVDGDYIMVALKKAIAKAEGKA